MNLSGTIVQFHWQFLHLFARVLAVALFASAFTSLLGVVCLVHWSIMLAWIVTMKTNFCHTQLEELIYDGLLAFVFIFVYFNPVDSPTRWRYTFYYLFMFVENVMLMTLWLQHTCDAADKWYRLPAFLSFFAAFFLGLVFMVSIRLNEN